MRVRFGQRASGGTFLGLTWGLAFLHIVVFALSSQSWQRALDLLAYLPVPGRPWWTLFTYQFLAPSPLSVIWDLLALYILGLSLEREWGTERFALFYLASVLGASGAAAYLGIPMVGAIHLDVSFLLAYALIWPETRFMIFFVIPIAVRWLAIVATLGVVLNGFRYGPLGAVVYACGMAAGAVAFLLFRGVSVRKLEQRIKQRVDQTGNQLARGRVESQNQATEAKANAAAAVGGETLEATIRELEPQIARAITICGPGDFKGTADSVCRACEGFTECTIRRLTIGAGRTFTRPT